jgi:hypothetical protein
MNDAPTLIRSANLSGMRNQRTLTEAQIKVLRALCTACNNSLMVKIDTRTIAEYANTNTLAAHKVLESLSKFGYVRHRLISNASTSGGAFKSGWEITGLGRMKAAQ